MTLTLGVCTPTDGSEQNADLVDLGAQIVRVALTKTHSDVPQWHRLQGRRVIGVVAAETFGAFGGFDARETAEHHHVLTLAQQRWGALLDYVELGNEPDDPGASSMGLPAKTWANLLRVGCEVFHANGNHDVPQLISGGLSSGQPSYLNGISIPSCNWLGLHSYDERLRGWPSATYGFGELEGYIEAYRPIWSRLRGVALSEWGVTNDADPFASDYIRRFVDLIRERPEVKLAAYFALSDMQSDTHHGLIRRDGTRKPQFSTYQKELSMPTFKLGFADYAAAHPKIGKALEDEFYMTPSISVQLAEGGLLTYSKTSNQVVCLPSGEPGK